MEVEMDNRNIDSVSRISHPITNYTSICPGRARPSVKSKTEDTHSARIIESNATHEYEKRFGIRGWKYATAYVRLTKDGLEDDICIDPGRIMTLIDRAFLQKCLPNAEILRHTPIHV